jgi:hypothetical protein
MLTDPDTQKWTKVLLVIGVYIHSSVSMSSTESLRSRDDGEGSFP